MKFITPKNSNYVATVVRIKNIIPLQNCDNVVATSLFGFQAIVKKGTEVGDLGIVFTTETRLSNEYCHFNNLYRHGNLNANQAETGYIEDNGRIKAVKFRGHVSNAIFMPLESLSWLGFDVNDLKEGDDFDEIDGREICRKYEVPVRVGRQFQQEKKRTHSRVDPKHLPEHISTSNFFKYGDMFSKDDDVIVTQKLHGTSIRIGHVIVEKHLNLAHRLLKKLGACIQITEFDTVYGSRKVLKDTNNPYQNHFYGYDLWSDAGSQLNGLLPENYVVYAELIGYTKEGSEIQRDYSYGFPAGTSKLFIYRVAIVNAQGISCDLSWDQVKEFCDKLGVAHVPELWRGKVKKLKMEDFIDTVYFPKFKTAVSLGDGVGKGLVDEGICIRKDGITPVILKAKSPKFFEHESKFLDLGEVDLESSQTEEV